MITHARQGLWPAADCDLSVLAHVPWPVAFDAVSDALALHRHDLAGHLKAAEEPAAAAAALREIADLTPFARLLSRGVVPPRLVARTLDRAIWALRRAIRFLESCAPPAALEDPVLADRLLDLLRKLNFLLDLLENARHPVSTAARRTA
ncbi:MAG: hypothetical protein HUU15_13850 [Candidatus Brocadiae bacterium]|nr:hypothetical protein [Candidatus Brocadiia bacterium]